MDQYVTREELRQSLDALVVQIQAGFQSVRDDVQSLRDEIQSLRADIRSVSIRTSASNTNRERQLINRRAFASSVLADLLPLVDIQTGGDIPGFPKCIGKLLAIEAATARRILDCLGIQTAGLDREMMVNKIHDQVK